MVMPTQAVSLHEGWELACTGCGQPRIHLHADRTVLLPTILPPQREKPSCRSILVAERHEWQGGGHCEHES